VRTRPKGFWDFSQGKTSGDFSKDRNRFVAYFSVSRRISDKKVSLRRELCLTLKKRLSKKQIYLIDTLKKIKLNFAIIFTNNFK
jgi:hypothetical protein